MLVKELKEYLEKCPDDYNIGVDVDGGLFDITYLWEDEKDMQVYICLDEETNEEPDPTKDSCGVKCNEHNLAAEI